MPMKYPEISFGWGFATLTTGIKAAACGINCYTNWSQRLGSWSFAICMHRAMKFQQDSDSSRHPDTKQTQKLQSQYPDI